MPHMRFNTARRGAGKFRVLRPRPRLKAGDAPVTVRFVEPKTFDTSREEASLVRESTRGMDAWDMERIDRRV